MIVIYKLCYQIACAFLTIVEEEQRILRQQLAESSVMLQIGEDQSAGMFFYQPTTPTIEKILLTLFSCDVSLFCFFIPYFTIYLEN